MISQTRFSFLSITWRLKCSTLLVLFFIQIFCADAYAQFLVEILIENRPMIRCDATGADFGDDVMAFSFGPYAIGCVLLTEPKIACSDVEQPRLVNQTACLSNFALVPRGNCTFSEKAYYVQKQYNALIIYNGERESPRLMGSGEFSHNITIPVVMVSYSCMESLVGHYSAANGYVVTIKASPGYYDVIKYLVPFVIIVGFCFVVLFISLVIRLWKEHRRLAKKRLSRSNLRKIPTKLFAKDDREETCAICLEDFIEGDKLRMLACRHAYHCKCIDPWLTKNRKVCPVCKRRVGPSSNDSSDSDSEGPSTSTRPRENEPLINTEQPMATSSSTEFPYPTNLFSSMPTVQISRTELLRNFLQRFRETRLFRAATASRGEVFNPTSNLEANHHSRELLVPDTLIESQPTRLAQLSKSFVYNLSRIVKRGTAGSLPHSRLENEEISTGSIDNDEPEFGQSTAVMSNLSSQSSNQASLGTDTNSLTTMYSTEQFGADNVNMPNDSQIE